MNRVLFKAAAIVNIAAAALIYVACSGDDGKDGAPGPAGAPCTGTLTATGAIEISCGSGPVGTLQPGSPGQNGQGVPADGCYLKQGTAGYDVICGGAPVGTLGGPGGTGGGCAITDGDKYWIFNCGGAPTQIGKAWCGDQPYNPSKEVCDVDGNISEAKCGIHVINLDIHFCASGQKIPRCNANFTIVGGDTTTATGGVEYDVATQFCARKVAAGPDSVYTRCGTVSVPNTDAPASVNPKGIGWFNPANDFCLAGTVTGLCGTNKLEFEPGQVCDGNIVKAMCGTDMSQAYDVEFYFCQGTGSSAKKMPLCDQGTGKGNYKYTDKEFCGRNVAGKDTVFARCGTISRTTGINTSTTIAQGSYFRIIVGDGSTTIPATATDAIGTPTTVGSSPDDVCTATGANKNTVALVGCTYVRACVAGDLSTVGTSADNFCATVGPTNGVYFPNYEFCATGAINGNGATTKGDGGSGVAGDVAIGSPTDLIVSSITVAPQIVSPATSGNAIVPLCGGKAYKWETQFCDSKTSGATATSDLEVYDRCGSNAATPYGKYTVYTHYCPTGATASKPLEICQNATSPTLSEGVNGYNPEKAICDLRDATTSGDDGKIYTFIKVGATQWLAENLAYEGGKIGRAHV